VPTITDFSAWLDEADPDTTDEIYDLYKSVQDESEGSFYTLKRGGDGKLFVKGNHTDDTLMIVPHAKELFLKTLWERCINSEFDIEGWYAFQKGMEKDD
jgi:hypothetical protein